MSKKESLCVVGLGYIGLPTASMFATHGFNVYGVDNNPTIIKTLQQGEVHIEEPGLATVLRAAIASNNLTVGNAPKPADVFIIAVPTPLVKGKSKTPKADMNYVEKAMASVVPHLKKGNLVILESTSPPGTIREIVVPAIEKKGFKAGADIGVAYCPERVIPGSALKELIGNDRIIGAVNEEWGEKVRQLYRSFVAGELFLTNPTTAEMVKLIENTYRDVNISLANETALMCEDLGIDVWEVINLANRHPRVNIHKPSPGVGGHCISVDPWFLVEKFPKHTKIIQAARTINDLMPQHVVSLIKHVMGTKKKAKITILGLSYKGNVDDIRESPSLSVINILEKEFPNFELGIYDPHVKSQKFQTSGIKEAFENSELAVLLTPHDEFRFLDPEEVGSLMKDRVLLDTHNFLKSQRWIPTGFRLVTLGSGSGEKKAHESSKRTRK